MYKPLTSQAYKVCRVQLVHPTNHLLVNPKTPLITVLHSLEYMPKIYGTPQTYTCTDTHTCTHIDTQMYSDIDTHI